MATAWMPALRQRRSGCPASTPFRQHKDVLSKSPAPNHGLAAHGWHASAKRGDVSSGHVSLAKQRKVARPPQADEALFALECGKSIAHECAPTKTTRHRRIQKGRHPSG